MFAGGSLCEWGCFGSCRPRGTTSELFTQPCAFQRCEVRVRAVSLRVWRAWLLCFSLPAAFASQELLQVHLRTDANSRPVLRTKLVGTKFSSLVASASALLVLARLAASVQSAVLASLALVLAESIQNLVFCRQMRTSVSGYSCGHIQWTNAAKLRSRSANQYGAEVTNCVAVPIDIHRTLTHRSTAKIKNALVKQARVESRHPSPHKYLRIRWNFKEFAEMLSPKFLEWVFRVAERRVAEMTGRGVVCYISNFSAMTN